MTPGQKPTVLQSEQTPNICSHGALMEAFWQGWCERVRAALACCKAVLKAVAPVHKSVCLMAAEEAAAEKEHAGTPLLPHLDDQTCRRQAYEPEALQLRLHLILQACRNHSRSS